MVVWKDPFALWFQALHIVRINIARFLSHIFSRMFRKKERSDKKSIKLCYGATNIFVVFFFFSQIISQKTFIVECLKIFIRVGKISKNLSIMTWKLWNLFQMFPSTWIRNSENHLFIFYHHKWDFGPEWNYASEITHVEVKLHSEVILAQS